MSWVQGIYIVANADLDKVGQVACIVGISIYKNMPHSASEIYAAMNMPN